MPVQVRERLLAGDGHFMNFPLAAAIFSPITPQTGRKPTVRRHRPDRPGAR
jgi:hypothetical protein